MSDDRRLYVVKFECEAVVLASSDDEAIEIAEANGGDITADGGTWDSRPLMYVPDGWGVPGTLVYHSGAEDIELFPLLMACPGLSDKAKEHLRQRAAALEVERAAKQKAREAMLTLRAKAALTPEG